MMKYPTLTQSELDALLNGEYDDDAIPTVSNNPLSEILVGKYIKNISISAYSDHMVITFSDELFGAAKVLVLEATGDCCSESWFAEIINYQAVCRNVITQVSVLELEECEYNLNDGRCRQDEDLVYGYRLTTSAGSCVITYRNSSNGYYGGDCNVWSLSLSNAQPYKDLFIRAFTNIYDYPKYETLWQSDKL